ncbi:MAG: NADAR family protein [Rikenellaceae bacterium]|nr:NADAR family protein [Rikenellaceae bacterium]
MKRKSSTSVAEGIQKYYSQYWGDQVYPIAQSVFFHKKTDEHWILSNMASCPLEVEGIPFKSSEHLFQTLKFATPKSIIAVYQSNNAKMTAKHYQNLGGHRREDWEQVLVDVMKFCLQQKYEQCPEFRTELERTKGYHIVELQDAKNDKDTSRANAWGVKTKGENYEGPNLMGRLLMELRDGTMEYKLPDDWNKFLLLLTATK